MAAWIFSSTARGRSGVAARPAGSQADAQHITRSHLSLREELPQALYAYNAATAYMREIMESAVQGRLNIQPAAAALEALIASLDRNQDALSCLARIRQNDAYAYTHSVNVAVLMALFARSEGFDRDEIYNYALAGLLHDLGKTQLPVALLNARRKLSKPEQTLVKRHPMMGFEMIARADVHKWVLQAVLEHHERYDGSGYPKGLSGDAISEIGHIAAVADAYDALSTRRPYQSPLHPHRSLAVMYQMRKRQFHPLYLEKFVRLVGIYPVGSVVELKDGYRGVVSASNAANPMKPSVILALDPQGRAMPCHEFDLAKAEASDISRCLAPEISGIDPAHILAVPR